MLNTAEQTGRVAVVGSGISGLAAALQLQRSGYRVELIERERSLGGRFGVAKLGSRDVMMGGKNIGRRYTSFRGFTQALGAPRYEPFGINQSRVKDGNVLTLDSAHRLRSVRHLLGGTSPRDLARLARLAVQIRRDDRNRFLGSPLFTEIARNHDHAPLSAHFGRDTTRYLLRPMTVRMNGAEPDEVYLGTFGTNLALLMDTYDQLKGGIQPVLEAIARLVTVRLGWSVDGLLARDGRVQGLAIADKEGGRHEERFDGVVLATPAYAAAPIVAVERPPLARRLAEVRYFPSTVALVEYAAPVFGTEVRALAMDDGPCSNAGSYGKDDRHIVRYTFSGRTGRPGGEEPPPLDDWTADAEARLRQYLGLRIPERVRTVTKHWEAAYSAYLPFHGGFLDEVHHMVAEMPGLELAGDYLRGVSLEACSRSGVEAAARLTRHLGETGSTTTLDSALAAATPR